MVKKCVCTICLVLGLGARLAAQTLPEDELQVNFSGYFDSFDVSVIYPNVSLTHRVSGSTSLTGRYLVDMVSAASIRNGASVLSAATTTARAPKVVDMVSAASGRSRGRVTTTTGGTATGGTTTTGTTSTATPGPSEPKFGDVRHQLGFGLARLVSGSMASLNGTYSRENDYSSATLAGTWTQGFAQKNATLQLGWVHSWDRVFPATTDSTWDRGVTTLSADFSQVLSKRLIVQVLSSYIRDGGRLSDDYQQILINRGGVVTNISPVHPDLRLQKAAAMRFKYRLNEVSSLQMGYRYYWDSWAVKSHTVSEQYQRYVSPHVIVGLGLRTYFQNRAFFFKPQYTGLESFMTADIKLDAGFSNEFQFDLTVKGGGEHDNLPFLESDRVELKISFSLYHRHTTTPYWFNNARDLISSNFNFGIRCRL